MGFLSLYTDTDTIDAGGGYWVRVRKHLSGAALDQIEGKRTQVRASGITDGAKGATPQVSTDIRMDLAGYRMELLCAAIEDWNLTDENDQLLPLHPDHARRASLKRIPSGFYQRLVGAVEEHLETAKRAAEDKATFPAGDLGLDPFRADDESAGSGDLGEAGLLDLRD